MYFSVAALSMHPPTTSAPSASASSIRLAQSGGTRTWSSITPIASALA